MTALLVLAMFVGFVLLDVIVRTTRHRMAEARARRHREEVLATSLRLDFSAEAPSLKRVEVPHPRARILAVDDEAVVLDSFRKVLVLAGYSVDTVESGPEALGLARQRDYELVFTDLKMPGMDGTEVVRAVRHLRPDIDVAVITGYGTIESAVETVREGAVDYVQKPFTEDELLAFVDKLVVKRAARQEAELRPIVRIVSPAVADGLPAGQYGFPGGVFLSTGHMWVRLEPDGHVRCGLDDFGRKAIAAIDRVHLPAPGTVLARGAVLARVVRGSEELELHAPISGKVLEVGAALARQPSLLRESPYDHGWICVMSPEDLGAELPNLKIGRSAAAWYQEEIERLRGRAGAAGVEWSWFAAEFLRG